MAKVVVTGGAGFIGSHLVEELVQRGDEVVVVDDLSFGSFDNIKHLASRIRFVQGDICNLGLLRRVFEGTEVVFHQAAVSSVPLSVKDPLLTNKINVEGSLNVFIAARDSGVKRVVYASSSAVYGDQQMPCTENMVSKPLSPYASQKLQVEHYGHLFFTLYGLETVGLRYFNVFGPRQNSHSEYSAVIPIFINNILQGKNIVIFGDGLQTRDFVYVADVVNANVLAAFTPAIGGEIFNIASGTATSILDLAQTISSVTERKITPYHEEPRKGDIAASVSDVRKARQMLDFASRVSLHEGIRLTLPTLDLFNG